MKQYYTWSIHDYYARYWTKEAVDATDEFGELYDRAEKYLSPEFNPNNLNEWSPPVNIEEKEHERMRRKGDFHSTWIGGHIVSQNMVDKLGNILREYGDFFPMEVEDRKDKLYRYWVNKEIPFECVDKDKSKFFDDDYKEDNVFKIEKLVFKENCKVDAMICRIIEEFSKTIFVSEDFIELIRENNLKGFNFEPDTSYEYGTKNGFTILIG